MEPKFYLKVSSREGIIYEGDVASVTSYNEKGKFDVLAQHANFISLISRGLEIVESDKKGIKKIPFDNALMRVRKNMVEVYVGVEGLAPTTIMQENREENVNKSINL